MGGHGLGEGLGVQAVGGISDPGGCLDCNSASLLRTSPMSSFLGAGPSGNVTLPTLINFTSHMTNYTRHYAMPGHKNPTPVDEAMVHHAKLAELE